MTVTCLISVKGAPGVTTLACLTGATWPEDRRVAIIEADPSGGDLAARFQLSTAWGWSSFVTAGRRSGGGVPLDTHLQPLPGGLEVLVLPDEPQRVLTAASVKALLQSCESAQPAPWDLVVDGGRLMGVGIQPGRPGDSDSTTGPWLDSADAVIIVTRRDPASILKVRHHASALRRRCGVRLHLVLVGPGPHQRGAIEEFTGLTVIAEIPFDGTAAQVVTGEGGSSRRLSRSLLVASARRLAVVLAGAEDEPAGRTQRSPISVGRQATSRSVHLLRHLLPWGRPHRAVGAAAGDSPLRSSSDTTAAAAPAPMPNSAPDSDSEVIPPVVAPSDESTPDAPRQDVMS